MFRLILSILFIAASLTTHAESATLRFAIDVIRHGDRTPVQDIPSTPYHWPQGLGELTPKGMQQEYKLGDAMRKRYILDNALLPQTFDVKTLYVRSTDMDRTLMSAQSLLSGLYPLGTGPEKALPQRQQVVPIHTVPKEQDTLLLADNSKEQYLSLMKKQVFPRKDWQQKTAELEPHFAHWSALTGIKIQHLYQLLPIADTLYIRGLYHLPLPAGMTQQEADTIINAGEWILVTAFARPEVGHALGQKLLSTIAQQLEAAAHQKTPLKAIAYFAHDTTILALMSAMHAPLKQKPGYASDLNFQLLQDGAEFQVEISLNGELVKIPVCQKTRCRLSELMKHL